MAVEKTIDGFDVECDGELCPENLSVESLSHQWSDLMSEMRNKGWRSLKEVDGQWVHLCPHCREDYD
jgi:hypothetical protein